MANAQVFYDFAPSVTRREISPGHFQVEERAGGELTIWDVWYDPEGEPVHAAPLASRKPVK